MATPPKKSAPTPPETPRKGGGTAEEHVYDAALRAQKLWKTAIQPYARHIAITIALMIALALIINLRQSNRDAKIAAAWRTLNNAESADTDALEGLVERKPAQAVAESAALKLAQIAFDEGQFETAVKQFDQFLDHFPNSQHTDRGKLGKAYALEGLGKINEAAQAFANLAEHASDTGVAVDATLGEGRCALLNGDRETARQRFEDARALAANTPFEPRAAAAMDTLPVL